MAARPVHTQSIYWIMTRRKLFRLLEFLLLFIGIPVVFYFDLLPVRKIVALLAITGICVLILALDPAYRLKKLLYRPENSKAGKEILFKSLAIFVFLGITVFIIIPESFFEFPRQRPGIWLIVMLLYPFLSALPQELIYRELFFHRYEKLFSRGWPMVVMSALSFGFLHIIYDNWWAVGLSLAGGFLFARTYEKTDSLWWVAVEHAIYGCLVFTVGMGRYFFEPF